ncbi:hypothetical protein SSP35_41_00060 [Streptomyces sp. NBRC 110611]|uniref:DUF3040 domain-containing protein n=1 Tax=Streptomyces sp. NBRC 110611 TaxID=1621259 RepID=UPI0008363126|nr:DUF3040 domain-containing protein [Streptomyces sp. NBRC 110611]GAU71462.1 hypothetical protein SSP35_41_00060 [Streptomyces sp. NBRC 110611]
MSKPSKDDRRILREMERHLTLDDPELAARLDALNDQFAVGAGGRNPDRPRDARATDHGWGAADDHDGEHHKPRGWRWTAAVVLGVLALIGMILVGIFTKPPPGDGNPGRPQGSSPAQSVLVRSPVADPDDRQILQSRTGVPNPRSLTEHPEGGIHART